MARSISSVLAASWLTLYLSSTVQANTINSNNQLLYTETGETVILSCSYSTSSTTPYLFWYRQYSHQMQYILHKGAKSYAKMIYNNTELEAGKFQSETSDTGTTLTIQRLTESDSAVYLCALSDGAQCCRSNQGNAKKYQCTEILSPAVMTCEEAVYQGSTYFTTTQDMFATLSCEYRVSDFRGLKWFRQYPGDNPEELVTIMLEGKRTEGRVTAELQKKNTKSLLHIERPQEADSALYLCAVDAQCEDCLRHCTKTTLLPKQLSSHC
ncbi:uncharacterized protein [Hyperolius riggenbachi]|uniref:uncharacterized protein n=1 Tax=Hyperolius riggenbachi TaxID=752182 RepID=UPI0035A39757